jgi:UDP-N-acetylglucosamine 2-epimerase (non-hydrolysing)
MKHNKYSFAFVIGTRAELIKTFPVMIELQKRKIPYYFIHTGQHSLGELCEEFGVKRPDVILSSEPTRGSKFNARQGKALFWNIKLLFRIRKELKKLEGLKYVFYHGDTMTTATASIASSKLFNRFKQYKNVHLEAGLRSFDNFEPFPEEISRQIAGKFSDILLAVSRTAEGNLNKYQNKKKIFLAGNTILDSVKYSLDLARKRNIKPLSPDKFALISIHRHENIKNKERMKKIVEILSELKIKSFFALHDNTRRKLEEFDLMEKIRGNKNIEIISPMNYVSFIYQISKCTLIICDGGSLQEESLIFNKPCIILRNATERPEGLSSNFQFLSKLDVEKTKEKIKEYLSPTYKVKRFNNPYGKVGVSKKIVEMLVE